MRDEITPELLAELLRPKTPVPKLPKLSGQASHNSNSSKKMWYEVIFRFSSCLLIPPITKASGKLPARPPVPCWPDFLRAVS
jgi:hypothetical protein